MEPGAAERRAKQLKAPNDCAALARLVAAVAPAMESAQPLLKAENILALLDAADAWRRPERFATLLDTLGCVLCGDSAGNVETLKSALEAANTVNAQSLMTEGFAGKALGEAIHRERLQRIQNTLQSI
jgi:tRNA nucleotidyltransferase (CCA-adding enzyme)